MATAHVVAKRKLKVILYNQEYPGPVELREYRMGLWKEGIQAVGDKVEMVNSSETQFGDVVITWGPRTTHIAHRKALHHLIMECGFLGDRLSNFYVGWSGLNGMGKMPVKPIKGRGEPWYHLLKKLPKRNGHRNLMICGQVSKDASLIPLMYDEAYRPAAYKLHLAGVARHFESLGLAVGFRGHPMDQVWTNMVRPEVFSFDEAGWDKDRIFQWADIAFAFSSNTLVEAFLEGIDVIPAHPTSLCWDVRSWVGEQNYFTHDQRIAWLDKVASCQWSADEIKSGEAWAAIRNGMM